MTELPPLDEERPCNGPQCRNVITASSPDPDFCCFECHRRWHHRKMDAQTQAWWYRPSR